MYRFHVALFCFSIHLLKNLLGSSISRFNFRNFGTFEPSNESPSMNIDITCALFTLRLGILMLNSQCKGVASDVNVHRRAPITSNFNLNAAQLNEFSEIVSTSIFRSKITFHFGCSNLCMSS